MPPPAPVSACAPLVIMPFTTTTCSDPVCAVAITATPGTGLPSPSTNRRNRSPHHPRPSFTRADTTFHFVDASPAEALALAVDAAGGRDVRIGGGVATVREFLDADLIDTMHVAVAPIELGGGERLWTSPDELLDRCHCDVVPSSSGVTHHRFWRR